MQQRRRAARFAEQADSAVDRVTVDKRACGWLGARAGELSSLVLQAAADSDLAWSVRRAVMARIGPAEL